MPKEVQSAQVRFEIINDSLRISLVEGPSDSERVIGRSMAELPLSILRTREDEQIQRAIGSVVISAVEIAMNGALDVLSTTGRIRAMESTAAVLKKQSDLGDPDAQYSLATVYMNLSIEKADASMLEAAEKLLLASASQGQEFAKQFLDGSWESIKEEYRKKIKR